MFIVLKTVLFKLWFPYKGDLRKRILLQENIKKLSEIKLLNGNIFHIIDQEEVSRVPL